MLYGKVWPSLRSQINCAYAPIDDLQSTCIESPGRRYDFGGSNCKTGDFSIAKLNNTKEK